MLMQDLKKFIFTAEIDTNRRKDTGMAIVLLLLIAYFFFYHHIFIKLALIVLIVNMTFPVLLHPFAVFWFAFSNFLGAVTSRIILMIVFFVFVTPIGLIRRLLRIDSMQLRKFKKSEASVMIRRNTEYTKENIDHPF